MHKYLLLFLLSLGLAVPSLAQDDTDTTETKSEWDDWDEWDEWDDSSNNDFDFDFEEIWQIHGAPTLNVNYGITDMHHYDLNGTFAEPRSLQLKLGYTYVKDVKQTTNITENRFKYLYVSNITSDMSNISADDTAYETDAWRFGVGKDFGYGYKFGQSSLAFTSSSALDWTYLKMLDTPTDSLDRNTTDLFKDNYSFGTSFEASIKFQIVRQVGIEANYERAAVFPRHLFWKWLGSAVIENAAQALVDEFTEEIMDSSPAYAPVIGFLLKNGVNYALYELREQKMNWPFPSAPPLMYDQFKFGVVLVL